MSEHDHIPMLDMDTDKVICFGGGICNANLNHFRDLFWSHIPRKETN